MSTAFDIFLVALLIVCAVGLVRDHGHPGTPVTDECEFQGCGKDAKINSEHGWLCWLHYDHMENQR